MRVVRQSSAQAAALVADAAGMASRLPAEKSAPARLGEARATPARAAIASAVFIVLLGAGLLFGGHAAIDPLLHRSAEMLDARGVSDVVVTMPDGKFCRHMTFDNTTASMVEGAIEPCTVDITRDNRSAVSTPQGFAWGIH